MTEESIAKDELFFHASHGLCRVAEVVSSARSKETCYTLLPVLRSGNKVRFVIPAEAFKESGFNKLITTAEAQAILEYFRGGSAKAAAAGPAWALAAAIWSESGIPAGEPKRNARNRNVIQHAAKGLVSELAVVLKLSLKDIAAKILKNLGGPSRVNPMVVVALEHVSSD